MTEAVPLRCEGRYPVPQTSPPRDEPFDVTYRCEKVNGHFEPCGPDSGAVPVDPQKVTREMLLARADAFDAELLTLRAERDQLRERLGWAEGANTEALIAWDKENELRRDLEAALARVHEVLAEMQQDGVDVSDRLTSRVSYWAARLASALDDRQNTETVDAGSPS